MSRVLTGRRVRSLILIRCNELVNRRRGMYLELGFRGRSLGFSSYLFFYSQYLVYLVMVFQVLSVQTSFLNAAASSNVADIHW